MRYGHLLAALIFVLILLVVLVMVLFPAPSSKKIDVSGRKGDTLINVSNNPTSTETKYYTVPRSVKTATVTYTETGFSPASLIIEAGTMVVFENKSATQFWPASDPHPDHGGYPGLGNCNGQVFDPCAPVAAGTSWSLVFDKSGNWGYHDHLNPSHTGTIIVK